MYLTNFRVKKLYLSLEPSGKANEGTTTDKRPSGSRVASHRTSWPSPTSKTNSSPTSPIIARSWLYKKTNNEIGSLFIAFFLTASSAMLASDVTGGSFLNPTPLPSVHLTVKTLTAWGTSGITRWTGIDVDGVTLLFVLAKKKFKGHKQFSQIFEIIRFVNYVHGSKKHLL